MQHTEVFYHPEPSVSTRAFDSLSVGDYFHIHTAKKGGSLSQTIYRKLAFPAGGLNASGDAIKVAAPLVEPKCGSVAAPRNIVVLSPAQLVVLIDEVVITASN